MEDFRERLLRGALLHVSRDLSVMKKADKLSVPRSDFRDSNSPGGLSYVLVADGQIVHKNLHALDLDEAFVWETIQDLGMEDISQIDVLEMSEDGSIYINKKKD